MELKVFYINDRMTPISVRVLHNDGSDEYKQLEHGQGGVFVVRAEEESILFVRCWNDLTLISYMEVKND